MKTEQPSFLQFSRLTFSQTLSEIKPRKPLFPYLPFTQLSFAKKAILSLLSSPPPSPSLPPFVPIARAFRSTAKKRSFQKSKGNTPEARDTRSTPTYPYGKFLFYSLRWRARTPRFPAENTWHTRRDTHALAHTHARSPSILLPSRCTHLARARYVSASTRADPSIRGGRGSLTRRAIKAIRSLLFVK